MKIYYWQLRSCPFSLQYKTKRQEIEPVKGPDNMTTAAPLTTTIMAVVKVRVLGFFMYSDPTDEKHAALGNKSYSLFI